MCIIIIIKDSVPCYRLYNKKRANFQDMSNETRQRSSLAVSTSPALEQHTVSKIPLTHPNTPVSPTLYFHGPRHFRVALLPHIGPFTTGKGKGKRGFV